MSVDLKNANVIKRYVASAEKIIEQNKNPFLSQLQNDAKSKLSGMNFPTLKTEEWKYTNLKKLLNGEFVHSAELDNPEITNDDVAKVNSKDVESYLLVVVNGVLNKELSDIEELNNEIVMSTISEATDRNQELIEKYFSKIAVDETAFDYLNLSNFVDGLFIQVLNNKSF
jgi:Fe-S cluster assembly protein SufD